MLSGEEAVDPASFLQTSRVVIVAGKGGVGKTVVAAALARLASNHGLRTLLVEIEGKGGLPGLFGKPPLTYRETELSPATDSAAVITGRTLTPDDALLEYLEEHGMGRVSKRLVSSGAVDIVATAAPGIKDILILGKVKQLERSGDADLIIVDAPAAGHAITFLMAARGLSEAVRMGPIRTQALDVLDLLGDPQRCSVILVTLPEETPVNELVETGFTLEDQVGIKLGPAVVNGVYPLLDGLSADPIKAAEAAGTTLLDGEAEALSQAAQFRRQRHELQTSQLERLAELLPLPQLCLPFLFRTDLGPAQIDELAMALDNQIRAMSNWP
ncbi:MAG: ArsA family ATPase [Acidimicrobiales bacterium]